MSISEGGAFELHSANTYLNTTGLELMVPYIIKNPSKIRDWYKC
jgi:hypothetical protein